MKKKKFVCSRSIGTRFKLLIYFMLCTSVSIVSSQQRVDTTKIDYPDFKDLSALQLNGTATGATNAQGKKVLRLTSDATTQAGSVFIKNAIPLVGANGFKASFSAYFSFQLSSPGGGGDSDGQGADGIVFVVQTISNNVGSSGAGIGFSGIGRSLGIEFDSFQNSSGDGSIDDPDGNHIGIDTNGSMASIKTVKVPKRLNDGEILHAWVTYDGDAKIVAVRLSQDSIPPVQPILTATLDLPSILVTQNAFVGFTSATGLYYNIHDILSFHFINTFKPLVMDLVNDQVFSVKELSPAGTFVGKVLTNSAVPAPVVLKPIVALPEFSFNTSTSDITVASGANLDFEVKNKYTMLMAASAIVTGSVNKDTLRDTAKVTINIIDSVVGDLISNQEFYIKELSPPKTTVGTVALNISDVSSVSLSVLQGVKEFDFDPASRVITVANGADLDFEKQNLYTMKLIAKAKEAANDTATITIKILDSLVGDLISNQDFYIKELSPPKTAVGTVALNIADVASVSLSVWQGVKEFDFDPASRKISVANGADLDFEKQNLYTMKLIAKAKEAADDTATMTIHILDSLEGAIEANSGYYFDCNADGYVDSIFVKATASPAGVLDNNCVKEIVGQIKLPAFRKFTIGGSGAVSDGFYVLVSEDKSRPPITYTTAEDSLTINKAILSNSISLQGGKVPLKDRIAPIIHWKEYGVYLVDNYEKNKDDTLFVAFSEPVSVINASQPFYFLSKQNKANYEVDLRCISQPKPDEAIFIVQKVTGVSYMDDGDSVWIHETDRVGDRESNFQNNNGNIHRRLYVRRIAPLFTYKPQGASPVSLETMPKTNVVSSTILSALSNQDAVKGFSLDKNDKDQQYGMYIELIPVPSDIALSLPDLKLGGTITIFDALGNKVVDKAPLAWWDAKKRLVYVWNCRNMRGRLVGRGTYLCLFTAEEIDNKQIISKEKLLQQNRLLIGIR